MSDVGWVVKAMSQPNTYRLDSSKVSVMDEEQIANPARGLGPTTDAVVTQQLAPEV